MDTFDRQILFFGEEGQRKLAGIRVGIVGLGGLGSHIAQQLALLGVRNYLLIDPELVADSNLNRLVMTWPPSEAVGRLKVDVAESLIKTYRPDAEVVKIPESFVLRQTCYSLREVDVVFGCVDTDGARMVLTSACGALQRAYLDVATDILPEESPLMYGGRTLFARGNGCLHCLRVLDDREVRLWMSDATAIAADERIYGKRKAGDSPAVVSLNGILASMACMEFMLEATGIRPANRWLVYDGPSGKMRVDKTEPAGWCPYCDSFTSGNTEYLDRLLSQLPEGLR